MKTDWDYTELAEAYLTRPDYSDNALDQMVSIANIVDNNKVCDIGAGVAHLTIKLANRNMQVTAVEPNDAMRALGIERTKNMPNINWFEGTGEETNQHNNNFDIVTFGSSFNVTNRQLALKETKRILHPDGWFAAMWNHRDLDDAIQKEIEKIIKSSIPEYGYGTRREDQTSIIQQSGLFNEVKSIEGGITHTQSIDNVVEAWKSHATLHRQAGRKFNDIINNIKQMLDSLNKPEIAIPYVTRIWMAQLK